MSPYTQEQLYHHTANEYAMMASDLAEFIVDCGKFDKEDLEDIQVTLDRVEQGGVVNDVRVRLSSKGA